MDNISTDSLNALDKRRFLKAVEKNLKCEDVSPQSLHFMKKVLLCSHAHSFTEFSLFNISTVLQNFDYLSGLNFVEANGLQANALQKQITNFERQFSEFGHQLPLTERNKLTSSQCASLPEKISRNDIPKSSHRPINDNTEKSSGDETVLGAAAELVSPKRSSFEFKTERSSDNQTISTERVQSLLKQQKDMSLEELETEEESQEKLTVEISELASALLESTVNIHDALQKQNVELSSIQTVAAENIVELAEQRGKMDERDKDMVAGLKETIFSILWTLLSFALTYIVIRLFPA
jgi:hypothetical protein